jgi:hypothetical protein
VVLSDGAYAPGQQPRTLRHSGAHHRLGELPGMNLRSIVTRTERVADCYF